MVQGKKEKLDALLNLLTFMRTVQFFMARTELIKLSEPRREPL